MDEDGIRERIERSWSELSPVERQIAQLLLERDDDDLAAWTTTELAGAAGASKASVSRFVRRLGFGSFAQARTAARSARARGVPTGGLPPSAAGPAALHVEHDTANLARTADALARVDLTACARSSPGPPRRRGGVAQQLPGGPAPARAALQARPDVVLAPQPGQTVAEEFADLGPRDAVVSSPSAPDAARGGGGPAAGARAGGAVVLFTDPAAGASGGPVAHRFAVPVDGPGAFDSYAAAMTAAAVLAEGVLAARGRGPGPRRRCQLRAGGPGRARGPVTSGVQAVSAARGQAQPVRDEAAPVPGRVGAVADPARRGGAAGVPVALRLLPERVVPPARHRQRDAAGPRLPDEVAVAVPVVGAVEGPGRRGPGRGEEGGAAGGRGHERPARVNRPAAASRASSSAPNPPIDQPATAHRVRSKPASARRGHSSPVSMASGSSPSARGCQYVEPPSTLTTASGGPPAATWAARNSCIPSWVKAACASTARPCRTSRTGRPRAGRPGGPAHPHVTSRPRAAEAKVA